MNCILFENISGPTQNVTIISVTVSGHAADKRVTLGTDTGFDSRVGPSSLLSWVSAYDEELL